MKAIQLTSIESVDTDLIDELYYMWIETYTPVTYKIAKLFRINGIAHRDVIKNNGGSFMFNQEAGNMYAALGITQENKQYLTEDELEDISNLYDSWINFLNTSEIQTDWIKEEFQLTFNFNHFEHTITATFDPDWACYVDEMEFDNLIEFHKELDINFDWGDLYRAVQAALVPTVWERYGINLELIGTQDYTEPYYKLG